MGWINTEVRFPERRICLTVSRRDAMQHGHGMPAELERIRSERDPLVLEGMCRSLIERHRPELSNCSLLWLDFSFRRYELEIGIEHPCLREREFACDCLSHPILGGEPLPMAKPPEPTSVMPTQIICQGKHLEKFRELVNATWPGTLGPIPNYEVVQLGDGLAGLVTIPGRVPQTVWETACDIAIPEGYTAVTISGTCEPPSEPDPIGDLLARKEREWDEKGILVPMTRAQMMGTEPDPSYFKWGAGKPAPAKSEERLALEYDLRKALSVVEGSGLDVRISDATDDQLRQATNKINDAGPECAVRYIVMEVEPC